MSSERVDPSAAPVAIHAHGIGKTYRIWDRPASRLLAPTLETMAGSFPKASAPARWLSHRAGRHYHDFHALTDISFQVRRGEALGIVGRNGSGKSTLLQIITGTLQATAGTVDVHGRVAALLELGSGFNPEFTGRENVFLNATILGLTREETEARFDSIAAYADIGDFIEQPVKTYSSGMQVRLAFAVAAHVEPEIFIVDEALAVGDARFQLKCARTIDLMIERGVTLLFVSHDLNMVKRLCTQALLLEAGRVVHLGNPNDVANLYSKLIADGGTVEGLAEDIRLLQRRSASALETETATTATDTGDAVPVGLEPVSSPPLDANSPELAALQLENATLRQRVQLLEVLYTEAAGDPEWKRRVNLLLEDERRLQNRAGVEFTYGGELGRIDEIYLENESGDSRTWFTTGETVEVRLKITACSFVAEPIYAMTIKDLKGQDVYGTNTLFSRQNAPALDVGESRVVRFRFPANLIAGEYFLSLGFTQFVGDELVVIHRRYDAVRFSIHGVDRCFGIANCFGQITVERA